MSGLFGLFRVSTTKMIKRADISEGMKRRLLGSEQFMRAAHSFYKTVDLKAFKAKNEQFWKYGNFSVAFEHAQDAHLAPHLKTFVSLMPRSKPEHNPVLEIGCGLGNSLKVLEDMKVKAVGVDISHKMLTYAANVNNVKSQLHALNVRKDELPKGPFRGVLMSDVLGYFAPHEQAELISKIYSSLSPEGIVFVRLALASADAERRAQFLKVVNKDTPDEHFLFGTDSFTYLKELLEAAYFTVLPDAIPINVAKDTGQVYVSVVGRKVLDEPTLADYEKNVNPHKWTDAELDASAGG